MRRPRRWRWWGKWMGVSLCAAVVALLLLNGSRMPGVDWGGTSANAAIYLLSGNIEFFIEHRSHPAGLMGVRTTTAADWLEHAFWTPPWFSWAWPSVGLGDAGSLKRFHATVPLWTLFVILVGLTAWLWHGDRRRIPGHCRRCNYDLSATASGPCPECGAPSV